VATRITNVRTETVYHPKTHRHVAEVLTADGRVFTRAQLVQTIDAGWEQFETYANGRTARVYTRSCNCGIRYATTTPDGTTTNNLLGLPPF
jgi:hypothetical protein